MLTARLTSLVLLCLLFLAMPLSAGTIRRGVLTANARQGECTPPRGATAFPSTQRTVYLWFEASGIRAGDRVQADWYTPSGELYLSNPWGAMPNASALCFLAALPVAGYAPAYVPGMWSVRVSWNDQPVMQLPFQMQGEGVSGGLVISGLSRSRLPVGDIDLTLTGNGFRLESKVLVDQLAGPGGYRRVTVVRPELKSTREMVVHLKLPDPAEYQLRVQNPDGQVSPPRGMIVGFRGFRLPLGPAEQWELTQGNVGGFSHEGNSIYAYDFAPRVGRCVVAMKSGIAYTYDGGLGQTPRSRSFGNYITIDHGNGEYSHYAHLQTGSFVVQNGQEVEAGQALAVVGTSGYSFGHHLHVHVTRAFPISSQSVPYLFEDVPSQDPDGPPPGQPVVRANRWITSQNGSSVCDCRLRASSKVYTVMQSLPEQQWWSDLLQVSSRTQYLRVTLAWLGDSNLDLHLTSPSGRHYGWSGAMDGYTGERQQPEQFRVPNPEPGTWRISVQARAAPSGAPPFRIWTTAFR